MAHASHGDALLPVAETSRYQQFPAQGWFWTVANLQGAIGAVSRRTCWQERESGEGGEFVDRSERAREGRRLATNYSSAQGIGAIESLTCGKALY